MNKLSSVLRKVLCVSLAAVTVGAFSVAATTFSAEGGIVASAADSYTFGDFQYQIVDSEYAVITKYAGQEADVVVPEQIHEFPIVAIAKGAFTGNEPMVTLTLPDSVALIDNGAFEGCVNLTSVKFPAALTTLGDRAFYGCTSLTSVELPENTYSIGKSAFSGCTSLTSVVFNSALVEIPWAAFYNCVSLSDITLPDFVQTIGYSAFANCASLTSIVIPTSTTTIAERAFANCSALSEVEMDESLQEIKFEAFYNCAALREVTIPSSVTTIGSKAFGYSYNRAVRKYIPHPDFVITSTSDSAAAEYAAKNGLKFIADDPLENLSTISSDVIKAGKAITITGNATGGKGGYTYSYAFRRIGNTKWNSLGTPGYSENTTVKFKPTADTIYEIEVNVKDAEGNVVSTEWALTPENDVFINTSTVVTSKPKVGQNVKIEGRFAASDNSNSFDFENITYAFYFKRSTNTKWKTLGTEFSDVSEAKFKPTAAGDYDIKVIVKEGNGHTAERVMTVTVK